MREEIDRHLLDGVRFQCRPGCGLCCHGAPAVDPTEQAQLLQIRPSLEFEAADEGYQLLRTRAPGGACQLLVRSACTGYAARPFPCRVYPLVTHIGTRVQSIAVLGCPGVSEGESPGTTRPEVSGLETERAAVERELARAPVAEWIREHGRLERTLARKLDRDGRWEPVDRLREELLRPDARRAPTGPGLSAPGPEAEPEELPIGFDEDHGVVLLRTSGAADRYEVLRARETGGEPEPLGTFEIPARLRPEDGPAAEALTAYRRRLVASDHFLWSTYLELREGAEGTLRERFEANLTEVVDEALRRGAVHALLHGASPEPLLPEHVRVGIRWTDSEVLDRPTLGRIL
jgi:Fe-S-cluster containining protein